MTERKQKRLKISVAVGAVLALSVAVAGTTFAWFSKTAKEPNTFSVATNKVAVTEEFTPPTNWHPSDPVSKKVCFTNYGQLDVYLRVPAPAEIWTGADGGYLSSQYIDQNKDKHDVAAKSYTSAWKNEWTQIGDYYYYKATLKPGAKTDLVMDAVTLDKNVPNLAAYQNAQYQLKFTVEAVQSLPQAAQQVWQMRPSGSSPNLSWTAYQGT